MELYRELYFQLFAAIADEVEALDRNDPTLARFLLIRAEQNAEERYLSAEDTGDTPESQIVDLRELNPRKRQPRHTNHPENT